MAERPSVVLHTSWRGRFVTVAAPVILLALGGYGIADQFRWIPFLLFVLGLVLAIVAVADYPIFTIIGAEGIRRRCLLRTEHLSWSDVSTIARPAQNSRWRREHPASGAGGRSGRPPVSSVEPAHGKGHETAGPRGGLVAEVKRRPHLLSDRVESRVEYDAIVAGMQDWAPHLPVRASRPDQSAPPTWLHKKRRGSASDGLVDLLA